ncbi:MAG: hypothetical protein Q8P18_12845 [Pseudomonadota bacterium]|nr:hypothetical protein [Pseudomonadota bacterium]
MKIRLLPILALALGFTLACGGGGTTTTTPPLPPPPPIPVAADGSIGVPECDDYIKKMESCIASADPATKAAMETGFQATRDAWAQAAAIPATKGTLASSCGAMLASVPTNCGSGAAAGTNATGTTATTATGTTATTGTNPDGTPAPTTTTTTTTTVVTTTDDAKATEPSTRTGTDKAPARDQRAPADMGRSRPGSGSNSGTSGTKSGSGSGTKEKEGSQGMGRSR